MKKYNKEALCNDLKEVILLLEKLIELESFSAYHTLLDIYKKALVIAERTTANETYYSLGLSSTTRRLQEAPPKKGEIGLIILNSMQKVYDGLESNPDWNSPNDY